MADNPYPEGTNCHKEWQYGSTIKVGTDRFNEYVAWARGVLAAAGFVDTAAARAAYLEGFDEGLAAGQEHAPPGMIELAANLLAAAGYLWSNNGISPAQAMERTVEHLPIILGESPLKDLARAHVRDLLKGTA